MRVVEERYKKAIEEIITINELQNWIEELDDNDIDSIINDIDIYYKLEMNINMDDEEDFDSINSIKLQKTVLTE